MSTDQLDDWMQQGYDHALCGDREKACQHWWLQWQVLQAGFTPAMTTFESRRLVDWAMFFQRSMRECGWHAIGIDFCRQVLGQFTAEGDAVRGPFYEALASFQEQAGAYGDARATLETLVREHPGYPWGYISLANLLVRRHRDPAGARTCLALGLQTVPVEELDPIADLLECNSRLELQAV